MDLPHVAQGDRGTCLLCGAPSAVAPPCGHADHRCPFGFEVARSLLSRRSWRQGSAEGVCVESVEAGVGDEAGITENETTVFGPDDAGPRKVEGELLAGWRLSR